MQLPSALRAFLAASLLFTLLCAGAEVVCRYALRWGEPYDNPTLHTPLRFVDYHAFFNKFAHFHSPEFFQQQLGVLPYPAPALVAYKIFLIPQPTPYHGTAAIARFEGSLLIVSGVLLLLLYRALVRRGLLRRSALVFALGLYVFSFPFWFEFVQGNVEWIVWAFLMLGIASFSRQHWKAAAVCIGIAGSMKIFPIIFVGLFVSARRYRELFLSLIAALASTLVSLWLICPEIGLSAKETLKALGLFEHSYLIKVRPVEVGFDHSLFALIKLILSSIAGQNHLQQRMGLYLATVAVLGCVLFFTRMRTLPLTNQVLGLTIAAVLLPPISYDYTLMHLYAALALSTFVAIERKRQNDLGVARGTVPGLWTAMLLLAFLLSPEQEFIHNGVRFAGQLKCAALLALWYVSLRYPFPLAEADARVHVAPSWSATGGRLPEPAHSGASG